MQGSTLTLTRLPLESNASVTSHPLGGTSGKNNFICLGGVERSFYPAGGGNEEGLVSVSLGLLAGNGPRGINRGLRKRNRSISSCLTSKIERPPYRRTRTHFLLMDVKNGGGSKLWNCHVNPFPSCYSLYLLLEI